MTEVDIPTGVEPIAPVAHRGGFMRRFAPFVAAAAFVASCTGEKAPTTPTTLPTKNPDATRTMEQPTSSTTVEVSPTPTIGPSSSPTKEPSPTITPTPEITPPPFSIDDIIKQGDALMKTPEGKAITFDSFATDITTFYTANPNMESVYPQSKMLIVATDLGDETVAKNMRMPVAGVMEDQLLSGIKAGIDTSKLLLDEYALGTKEFGVSFKDTFRVEANNYLQ